MTTLREALSTTGLTPDDTTATITGVNTTAGTVDLDLGGGQLMPGVRVLSAAFPSAPSIGQLVAVMRYPSGQRIVLGPVAATLAAPSFRSELAIPWTVLPATAGGTANPLVVSAVSSRSWRPLDGWSRPDIYQGAYSAGNTYWEGLAFHGAGAFSALTGRTCQRFRVRLARINEGGNSSWTRLWVAMHAHATQPTDRPLWVTSATSTEPDGSVIQLERNTSDVFDLPPAWGQMLINGTAAGVGLLRLAAGNGEYSISPAVATDPAMMQITLDWS